MSNHLSRYVRVWLGCILAMSISLSASDPLNVTLDAERYSAPENDFAGYYTQDSAPAGYDANDYQAYLSSHPTGDYGLFHVTGWGGVSSVVVSFKVDGTAYVTTAAQVAAYQNYLATGVGVSPFDADKKYYIIESKAGASASFVPVVVSPASPPTVTGGVFTVTMPPGESDIWVKVIPVNDENATGATTVNLEIQSSFLYAIGDVKSASMVMPDDDIQAQVTMPIPVTIESYDIPAATRIEYSTTKSNHAGGLGPRHDSEFVIDLRNRNSTDPTVHPDATMGLAKDKDYTLIYMRAHPGDGTYGNENQFYLGIPSRIDDWTRDWAVAENLVAGSTQIKLSSGTHGHFLVHDFIYTGLGGGADVEAAEITAADTGYALTDTITTTTTVTVTTPSSVGAPTTTVSFQTVSPIPLYHPGTTYKTRGPYAPGATDNFPPVTQVSTILSGGTTTVTTVLTNEVVAVGTTLVTQLTLAKGFSKDLSILAKVYNFDSYNPPGDPDYVTIREIMGPYYGLEIGALPSDNLFYPAERKVEGAELVRLRVLDPFAYPTPQADYKLLNPATATMVIADVDSYASWGVAKNAIMVPGASGTAGFVTVNLTSPLPHDADISISIDAVSTAIEGADFKPIIRTQRLKAGQSSISFAIEPKDNIAAWDTAGDQSRTIRILLKPSTEYLLTASAGSTGAAIDVNITKGAGTVSVVATTPSVQESTISTVPGTFTVNIARASGVTRAVSVNYTVSGTATAGTDYSLLSGSVTIPANQNSAAIPVTVIPDTKAEGNETILITLATGDGYAIDPTPATMTIVDAAPQIQVSADVSTITEGGVINVTLSYTGAQAPAFPVSYALSGTATSGLDYADPGILQFSDTSKILHFPITPNVDGLIEGDETLTFTLKEPLASDAYFLGAQKTFTVTIHDADVPQDPTSNDKPAPSAATPPTSSGGGNCGLGSGLTAILLGLLFGLCLRNLRK